MAFSMAITGLLARMKARNLIVGVGLDAAGVYQGERLSHQSPLAVDAVPGYAGCVLHDGKTPSRSAY